MAIISYKTFLMMKEASNWKKLIDIKEFPDLGGSPDMVETTTLSDRMQTFAAGIMSAEALKFPANYSLTDYKKLKALAGQEKEYAVWLGGTETEDSVTPTGVNGKFEFKGELAVSVSGAGVNDVVGMEVTIAPSSVIVFKES